MATAPEMVGIGNRRPNTRPRCRRASGTRTPSGAIRIASPDSTASATVILLILIRQPVGRVVFRISGIAPIGAIRIVIGAGPTAVVATIACVIVRGRIAFGRLIEAFVALTVVGTVEVDARRVLIACSKPIATLIDINALVTSGR